MTETFSRWWRVGALSLSVIASMAALSLGFRPEEVLGDKPLSEDGYYALSVARHLALGHGITIDGESWTSGIQPLFTFLCAVPFWLTGGDRFQSLRGVLWLHALFFLATAWLLGLVAREALADGRDASARIRQWTTVLLCLGSGYVFLQSFNGLETGFSLFGYALAWRLYQKDGFLSSRSRLLFGVLLGFCVLARVDAIFAVAVAVGGAWYLARAAWRSAFLHAVQIGLPAVFVSSPWWIYNKALFGSWMPSGGRAQQQLGFTVEKVQYLFNAVALAFTPEVHLARFESTFGYLLRAAVAVALAVWFVRWLKRGAMVKTAASNRTLEFAIGLLITYTLLAGFYGYQSGARQFFSRYLAAFSLPALVGTAILLTEMARARALTLIAVGMIGTTQACAIAYTLWTMRFAQSNRMYTDQLALIERHVPSGEKVAAFQSGTIGYFRDGVINLDGKVNAAALAAREQLGDYLRTRHANWYCDWFFFSRRAEDKAQWELVEAKGDFQIYRKIK